MTMTTNINVLLSDGYPVTQTFYDSLRQQVEEALPAMERDARYTLEMLCGATYWDQFSRGERRIAGRCMSCMVERKLLPLCVADTKHEYPKYYQLEWNNG